MNYYCLWKIFYSNYITKDYYIKNINNDRNQKKNQILIGKYGNNFLFEFSNYWRRNNDSI